MYNDIFKSDSQLQAPHLSESESSDEHDLQLMTDSTLLCIAMLMQLLLYYTTCKCSARMIIFTIKI